jgi:hypothetical protein
MGSVAVDACIKAIDVPKDSAQTQLLKDLIVRSDQLKALSAIQSAIPCLAKSESDFDTMTKSETKACIAAIEKWQASDSAKALQSTNAKEWQQGQTTLVRAKARAYSLGVAKSAGGNSPMRCRSQSDDDIADLPIETVYECLDELGAASGAAEKELVAKLRKRSLAIEQPDVPVGSEAAKQVRQQGEVELQDGSAVRYGVTTTLLKLQASRKASSPARLREYEFGMAKLPLDLGFQFGFRPNMFPYRIKTTDKDGFQLISVGGMLTVKMSDQSPSQAEITIGLIVSFFDESVSVGLGFDLYRGVPVQGPDGSSGSGTASTGLLAWAWSRHGEITPENVSLLLTVNLSKLAGTGGSAK